MKAMNRSHLILVTILAAGVILGGAGAFFSYQYTLQPSIQATEITANPLTSPKTITWLDMGRITGTGSFNYHPINTTAEYVLTFSNTYSASEVVINFKYTTHWPDYAWVNFTLLPGVSRTIQVHANAGQQLGGDFWISGETNDIDFKIIAYACTGSVFFSCSLKNTGSWDGFADVAFTIDGSPVWSDKYFVPVGSTIPISGSVTIDNCITHRFDVVVQRQYKP